MTMNVTRMSALGSSVIDRTLDRLQVPPHRQPLSGFTAQDGRKAGLRVEPVINTGLRDVNDGQPTTTARACDIGHREGPLELFNLHLR